MESYSYKKIKYKEKQFDIKLNIYRALSEEKGIILYFHGGGLIYGSRLDLPRLHKEKLRSKGYTIISFDYRLAPESNLDEILSDVKDAVNFFLDNRKELKLSNSPYFLWGRSAGAYLALMLSNMKFQEQANGVISFYGYAFTVENWFNNPSPFYLKYPNIKEDLIENKIGEHPISVGDINKRFLIYLYARQSGKWLSILTNQSLDDFLNKYSLKYLEVNFTPAFFAYSFKDTDVPFRESIELAKRFHDSSTYTNSLDAHDFDRDEKSSQTKHLLNKMVEFLDSSI
nr:alpha/beta hydrolase [Tissierella sp.]